MWTSQTASSKTWTVVTGSDATYTTTDDAVTGLWIPFGTITDLWGGVDFVPKASADAAGSVSSRRPIAIWNRSTVTSSRFTAEGQP
jgi:hypothetical protein